jgi:acetoin utilization protein AcuB
MDHIPSIGSVMSPFPRTVQLDASLLRARALMVEYEVRHLPVKDGDMLVGILTDRDLKRALDPDLGLPPKEELFVRDVAVRDAWAAELGARETPLGLRENSRRNEGRVVTTHSRKRVTP